MGFKKWCCVAMCIVVILISHSAVASLIDFEDLASPDELYAVGETYSSQGYIFTYTPALGEPYPTGLFAVGPTWIYNPGSTALFANSDGATTTLSRGGQEFSLLSIDLAELNGPGATSVLFEGTKSNGQQVLQTFYLDGLTGFESFQFSSDFDGVISVSWKQGDNVISMAHMFDNVNITATTPVPEPSIMLLLGSGLIGLAGYGRKKFFKK